MSLSVFRSSVASRQTAFLAHNKIFMRMMPGAFYALFGTELDANEVTLFADDVLARTYPNIFFLVLDMASPAEYEQKLRGIKPLLNGDELQIITFILTLDKKWAMSSLHLSGLEGLVFKIFVVKHIDDLDNPFSLAETIHRSYHHGSFSRNVRKRYPALQEGGPHRCRDCTVCSSSFISIPDNLSSGSAVLALAFHRGWQDASPVHRLAIDEQSILPIQSSFGKLATGAEDD